MPNFSDPAINQASNIVQQAQNQATAQAKAAASNAMNAATGIVTEAASKAAATVESAVQQATSAVSQITNAASSASSLASSITSAAQNALSSVLGGLATSAGSTPFALPTFLSKPDATIGVKDVYGVVNSAVENLADIPGMAQSKELTNAIQGAGGLESAVAALTQNSNGSLSLDTAGLTSRIKDALGGSTAALGRLGDTATSAATSGLNGPTGALMSTFESTIASTSNSFSTTNITDAKGLFDTVNQLTNNSQMAQYFDVGAEASLLTGLFQEAVNLQLPEAITVLADNANSTVAANQALKNVTTGALSSGNLSTVNLVIDQLGTNQVLSIAPQAAAMITQSYTLPKGTNSSQLAAAGTTLINTLNRVDPKWMTVERNNDTVSSLNCFEQMSADTRKVLMAEGTYVIPILIAGTYPKQSFLETIGEMYPLSPLVFKLR